MRITSVSACVSLALSATAQAQTAPAKPPLPTGQAQQSEPETSISQEEFYARDYGVSKTEAARRMSVMRDAGALAAKLRKEDPANFAGMEIQHKPSFQVVVRFTQSAKEKLAALEMPEEFVAQDATDSERAVLARQEAIGKALQAAGVPYNSAALPDGTIDIIVEDADSFRVPGLLRAAGITGTERTRIRKTKRIPRIGQDFGEASTLLAGDEIYGARNYCSAGFTVKKTGTTTRYKLTAGHCENELWSYNGTYLPFVGERYAVYQPYDFQWHSQGTFNTFTNTVKNGATATLASTAVYPDFAMVPGEYLCKYGRSTYKTCGKIYSTSYDQLSDGGKFVQVRSETGADLSSGGDSGAPWFSETYKEAWGVHSNDGRYPDERDAIFMPIKRISDAGLEVLVVP